MSEKCPHPDCSKVHYMECPIHGDGTHLHSFQGCVWTPVTTEKCICNEQNPMRQVLCPVHGVIKYKDGNTSNTSTENERSDKGTQEADWEPKLRQIVYPLFEGYYSQGETYRNSDKYAEEDFQKVVALFSTVAEAARGDEAKKWATREQLALDAGKRHGALEERERITAIIAGQEHGYRTRKRETPFQDTLFNHAVNILASLRAALTKEI